MRSDKDIKGLIKLFTSSIANTQNIFDIMAIAYSNMGQYYPLLIKGYESSRYKKLFEAINVYNESTHINSFFDFKLKLIEWCNLRKKLDSIDYFAIIYIIDKFYRYQSIVPMNNGYFEINALNTTMVNKIVILPRIHTSINNSFNENLEKYESTNNKYKKNGLRGRRDGLSGQLNFQLKNYDIIEISGYTLVPKLHATMDYKNIHEAISNKGVLNVACFPLTSMGLENIFNVDMDEKTFSITSIKQKAESDLLQGYYNALNVCRSSDIDFAIFPEMLLTENILEKITQRISTFDPDELPYLFILGSIWKDNSNRCVVMTNYGEIVFEQYKQVPFVYKDKIESLNKINNTLNLVDIEGIGRLLTQICIDIKNPHFKPLAETLLPDIEFLVSYTPSSDLFTTPMYFAEERWCITFMCNSCSAICQADSLQISPNQIEKSLEIGFVYTPAKNATKRCFIKTPINLTKECYNCVKECTGRIISIDLTTIKKHSDGRLGQDIYIEIPKNSL